MILIMRISNSNEESKYQNLCLSGQGCCPIEIASNQENTKHDFLVLNYV